MPLQLSIKNKLIGLLLLKAIFLGFLIVYSGIGLYHNEAQYWTWSKALDWGYYSKPPGAAWQIFLTTSIFGDTEFGVRFGALIIGFFLPLIVYDMARNAEVDPFWSAIVMAFSPLGFFTSFVANTDLGMILFFTLAVALLIRKEKPNYPLIGCSICLGALYKWTAYFFWPIVLILWLFFKSLRSKSLIVGILISLLALLPTLYWNWHHDWATFRHTSSHITFIGSPTFSNLVLTPILYYSPILFGLLLLAYVYLRRGANQKILIAGSFPLIFLVYLALSLFKRTRIYWPLYLYPPGCLLIVWVATKQLKSSKWLLYGTGLSLFIILASIGIQQGQQNQRISIAKYGKMYAQYVGWHQLADALKKAGYESKSHFLFGDRYHTASLLSFYYPDQKKAYVFNLEGLKRSQFFYWPQMWQKEVGKTGFFITFLNQSKAEPSITDENYQGLLEPYFDGVAYKGAFPLYVDKNGAGKYALIFECRDYNGTYPEDPELF